MGPFTNFVLCHLRLLFFFSFVFLWMLGLLSKSKDDDIVLGCQVSHYGRVQPLDPLAHQSHVSPAKNIRWANVGDLKIYFKSLDI